VLQTFWHVPLSMNWWQYVLSQCRVCTFMLTRVEGHEMLRHALNRFHAQHPTASAAPVAVCSTAIPALEVDATRSFFTTTCFQVSKQLWEGFKATAHSWFDYNESGNKQVTIVYSLSPPTSSGKKSLLPWEPGSLLPPFLQQMHQQTEAAQVAKREATRGGPHKRR
jgi:hypothetical protein